MTDQHTHELRETPVIFAPSGDGTPRPMSPDFFATLDQDFPDFKGHVMVMEFAFETDWPTWEIHPHGDELVYLLEGDTDFVLRLPDGDKRVNVNQPGSYVLVPRNTWHTARPNAPTRMLFITPGEGTMNEETPPE